MLVPGHEVTANPYISSSHSDKWRASFTDFFATYEPPHLARSHDGLSFRSFGGYQNGEAVPGQSREDLHKIRLVNKSLATAAAPFLLQTFSVWIELESLDALTGVSEHLLLSQYVKKIAFSPMRFFEYTDESTLQTSASDALESAPVSLNSRAISIGKHIVA